VDQQTLKRLIPNKPNDGRISSMGQLKITWTKSCIGRPKGQRRIIDSLGLKRLNDSVLLGDTPTIRGMVDKVQHLLQVEQIEEQKKPTRRRTRKASSEPTAVEASESEATP